MRRRRRWTKTYSKKCVLIIRSFSATPIPRTLSGGRRCARWIARGIRLRSLVGAQPNEIYFTSGGTESDNWAILGGAYAQKEKGRKHVVLSSIEHHAALSAGERLEKEGFSVTWLPVNERGRVEPSELKRAISEDTGLICVMAANNETGVIQPFAECARIARENGSLFFTDAVQALRIFP